MNIIQVSAGIVKIPPERGGAVESHIVNISKHLSKENEVTIIDRKYDDPDENEINGIKVHRIPSRSISLSLMSGRLNPIINEYLFSRGLRRCEIFKDADIVHAHNVYTANAAVKIANKYEVPFVYTCHNGMWCTDDVNLYEKAIVRKLESKIMSEAVISIAVSENLRRNIIQKGRVPEEKIVTIYNGVDTSFFNPYVNCNKIIKRYDLEGYFTVVFVGRIAPAKGIEYLIKALKELKDYRIKALLVGPFKYMFQEGKGKSKYAESLLSLVEKYNLQNKVIFTDAVPREDLPKYYAVGDVFVLPSIYEAMPMVLVEAMACGKPLIGSKVGGIPEVIEDCVNGFLFEPKNYKDLAEKILMLMKDENLRKEKGKNSRKIVEKTFSWNVIAQQIYEVYKKCVY